MKSNHFKTNPEYVEKKEKQLSRVDWDSLFSNCGDSI